MVSQRKAIGRAAIPEQQSLSSSDGAVITSNLQNSRSPLKSIVHNENVRTPENRNVEKETCVSSSEKVSVYNHISFSA